MGLDQLLDDSETQPRTATAGIRRSRFIYLIETFEDTVQFFSRNSRSRVLNHYLYTICRGELRSETNFATLARVEQSIIYQVGQDLGQPIIVSNNHRYGLGIHLQGYSFLLRLKGEAILNIR